MKPFLVILPAILCIFDCIVPSTSSESQCNTEASKVDSFTLYVNGKPNPFDGHWIRTYSAKRVSKVSSANDFELEAKHSSAECKGKHTLLLEVVVKEIRRNSSGNPVCPTNDCLLFHEKHGQNVVIMDHGRSAQKLNPDDPHNAILFTSRPLKDDELFEIRMEKKIKKTNHALGIGVVNFSPDDVEILPQLHVRNETWIMKHNNLYQNNKSIKNGIGINLDTLGVNDRVGVMRSENGNLHFFVNGADQGVAATNVPPNVYGALELWHDAIGVKIMY